MAQEEAPSETVRGLRPCGEWAILLGDENEDSHSPWRAPATRDQLWWTGCPLFTGVKWVPHAIIPPFKWTVSGVLVSAISLSSRPWGFLVRKQGHIGTALTQLFVIVLFMTKIIICKACLNEGATDVVVMFEDDSLSRHDAHHFLDRKERRSTRQLRVRSQSFEVAKNQIGSNIEMRVCRHYTLQYFFVSPRQQQSRLDWTRILHDHYFVMSLFYVMKIQLVQYKVCTVRPKKETTTCWKPSPSLRMQRIK